MKPDTQLLHSVWKDTPGFDLISNKEVPLDQFQLDELIASVFSSGPFYFYIVDFFDMSIKYMSPSIQEIHGLSPDAVTFHDILEQIHPEDMGFVAKAEQTLIELFYEKTDREKLTKSKVSYCFRCRVRDGSYQLFNHQAILLTVDEQGRFSKSLNIHTNISHIVSENNYKASVIGLFGEPSYLNIDIGNQESLPKASPHIFSKRERQIIRLMSDGLTSAEISRKLFIAENTVKNHRKNILQKAGCKNVGQLISKCIIEGLL